MDASHRTTWTQWIFWAVVSIAIALIGVFGVTHRPTTTGPTDPGPDAGQNNELLAKLHQSETALGSERVARGRAETQARQAEKSLSDAEEKITQLERSLHEEQQSRRAAERQRDAEKTSAASLSADSQRRFERMRENIRAGRWRSIPAPDGSRRRITITWDGTVVEVVPAKMVEELHAR